MASTTLNTFILPPPPFSVRAVEIKGSWDNFSQSYKLNKDGQTGHWRGCHTFEKIVCDGTTMDVSSSRDGGLKMGGTYWYYYILHTIDGDLEYHNAVEPSTDSCPLLPGQHVNILDVPVQADLISGRNVSSTSLDSMVFTLDPKDKYLTPGVRRASTTTAIKGRKAQINPIPKIITRSSSTPLDSQSPPKTSTSSYGGQSDSGRQRSLMAVFHKIRQTRSAGSNAKSSLAWPRRLLSRTGNSAKIETEYKVPEVPKLPSYITNPRTALTDGNLDLPTQRRSTACSSIVDLRVPDRAPVGSIVVPWPQESTPLGDYRPSPPCLHDPKQEIKPKPFSGDSSLSTEVLSATEIDHSLGRNDSPPLKGSIATMSKQASKAKGGLPETSAAKDRLDLTIAVNQPAKQNVYLHRPSCDSQTSVERPHCEDKYYSTTHTCADSARFSYVPSENFSPGFTSNTTHSNPMSPLHLSQPATPVTSEFGDCYDQDFLGMKRDSRFSAELKIDVTSLPDLIVPRPPSRAPPPPPASLSCPSGAKSTAPCSVIGGFQGYSLSKDDHTSALTLRKLPSATLKHPSQKPSLDTQAGKRDLVRSWNDGSEHLLDDLGYLGEMII